MELTSEMKSVAMRAKSVEELLKLAEEYGYEVSKDEAEEIYAELNKEGELSDEELENVTGGSCYSKDNHGLLIVTLGNTCDGYVKILLSLFPVPAILVSIESVLRRHIVKLDQSTTIHTNN